MSHCGLLPRSEPTVTNPAPGPLCYIILQCHCGYEERLQARLAFWVISCYRCFGETILVFVSVAFVDLSAAGSSMWRPPVVRGKVSDIC